MFRSTMSTFDRLLEKSTSHLLLEPDWTSILALCDSIRGGDTPPKYAVSAIKKKFYHDNPHVQYFALQVMESCVKNCGALIHDEIATRQFMEELREIVKRTNDENIKKKVLEMIQHWGMAFRNSPKYRIVTDTLNLMKAEGWEFPPVREAEAMFEADVAPEWAEGEVCHRCRTQFGLVTRQHHCRACGQVFCGKCSSKFCVLPKFGIEKEVRVCDSCFDQFGPKETTSAKSSPVKSQRKERKSSMDANLPAEYLSSSLAQQPQNPPVKKEGKSEEEIKEEEELQLAIALSESEAEAKAKAKQNTQRLIDPDTYAGTSKKPTETKEPGRNEEEISPELMRYLNRDYWEQKETERSQPAPAVTPEVDPSPVKSAAQVVGASPTVQMQPKMVNSLPVLGGAPETRSDEEMNEFVTTLKTQVEIFVNRMKSNSSRGRSIANDSSVQTLFMNMMAMHSQLLKHIQDQEDKRVHFEGLQDQLTQIKDARAALDALREEEKERKRRDAEEAERIKQIQMSEKLEVMRQRKQEYLQYQRQMALQRMQEQEREMMMRQEQVKQQYGVMAPGGQPQPPESHMGSMGMPMYGAYPGMHAGMMPTHQPGYPGVHMGPPQSQVGGYPDPSMMPHSQPHYGMLNPGEVPPGSTPSVPNPVSGGGALPPAEGFAPPVSTATAGGGVAHGHQPPPTPQSGPHNPHHQPQHGSPFNMQGMVSALPASGIMSNAYGAASSMGQHPHYPGQVPMGDPGQAVPPQENNHLPGAPTEAELICFD
ncbi:hepatocyte growth factor-regulated tyrosine kinase substrate-like [Tigriopus californicus]|uniref:hepatocyte growth factor-regulated tyrosine kinase substrate-like n=1 Tax=Tigriopus californicus TaxID=6832 RepID=UPI0027DA8BB2|nr:hepatocyte growth factor-regulated tyrosine kinase substrate-like [Tigriopus californicus]